MSQIIPSTNLVYIDSMIWIDCAKSPELYVNLQIWLRKNSFEALIQPNLVKELFNPRFEQQFDVLWEMIEDKAWSKIKPEELVQEEIHYFANKLEMGNILLNKVMRLTDDDKAEQKKVSVPESTKFHKEKGNRTAAELFIKIAKKNEAPNLNKEPLLALIRRTRLEKKNITPDKFSAFDDSLKQHIKKGDAKQDVLESTQGIITNMKSISPRDFFEGIDQYVQYLMLCGFEIDEKFLFEDFMALIILVQMARAAFDNGKFSDTTFEKVLSLIAKNKQKDLPGLNVAQSVSKAIRKSEAKTKPSDPIDFINLVYFPYTKKYITDGHIVDETRKLFPEYREKLISASDFRKIIESA